MDFTFVTNHELLVAIQGLQARIVLMESRILMSESTTQSDINNVATALNAFVTDAGTDLSTIQTALNTLSQQVQNGQPVDTSSLDTASSALASVQTALDTLSQNAQNLANPPATPTA